MAIRKERSAVLILEDGEVLLMRRVKQEREYYVVPGGGVEDGETPEQAAIREAREETGLSVELERKLITLENRKGRNVHYFLAASHRGELGVGFPERDRQTEYNVYDLEWIGPDKLEEIDLNSPEVLHVIKKLLTP